MAYTNTPEKSTYRTVNIPFNSVASYRSGDLSVAKDAGIINGYYESISQPNKESDTYLVKRPGLAASGYNTNRITTTHTIRGSFYNEANNSFYWAFQDKVYFCKPDTATTVTLVQTLTTTSGQVGFCSYLKSDNTAYVVFTDGTDMFVHNTTSGICTEVTDVDFPTPIEPFVVYLNGYLAVVKKDTGDLYTCVNDDPLSWVAGDFITAEMSSDYLVALAKSKNYIVAFGKNSIEHFYDAGIATGSPLQRYDSAYRSIGYITGLTQIGDALFFVGQDKTGNVGVYVLESFDAKRISTQIVDKTLQAWASTDNVKSDVELARNGYGLSINGHWFYVLVTQETTWVFDVQERFWYEWKNSSGTKLNIEATFNMTNGAAYVIINGQQYVSIMSPSLYQDFGTNFTMTYTTERLNFGSMNQKFMSRATLLVDRSVSTGSSDAKGTIAWTDDDYLSYNTPRNVNLYSELPALVRLGHFRNRAFKISYTGEYPLRLQGLEVELNIGAR